MTPATSALLYAALAALPATMQIALAAGAPLGRFTVGGRFPGRLPGPWRVLALVQAAILAGMACAVLDRAGVLNLGLPPAAIHAAIALTALTCLANAISPSRPERLVWTPVTAVMLAKALCVAFPS